MYRTGIAITILVVLFSGILQAQQPNETATPAPSKTPNASVGAEATAENLIDPITIVRPFVQDDLSLLVGNVQRPNAIAWLNGKLYIICNGDWTIYEVDAVTGGTITFISGIRDAHQIYAEDTEDGFNLWIPDFETNQLMLVTHRRSSPRMIVNDGLNAPWGIIPFNDDFLISNLKEDNVVLVSREGELTEVVSGLRSPAGLASDDEFVYVANNGSARRAIEWFPRSAVEKQEPITSQPLISGLQNASSITLGADGYLYFAYSLGNRGVVGRIQPDLCRDTGCTNEQVEVVLYTELPAPLAGLTLSPDMTLFVHTIYRPELYRLDLTP